MHSLVVIPLVTLRKLPCLKIFMKAEDVICALTGLDVAEVYTTSAVLSECEKFLCPLFNSLSQGTAVAYMFKKLKGNQSV